MNSICFWNSHKFWGGGEKLHLEYAEGFQNKNHHCFIVADPKSPLRDKAEALQLKVHPFRIKKLDFLNPLKIYSIVRFFKQTQTDTLIFSSSQDMKAAGMAAYIAGVSKIVYLRGLAVPIKNNFINRFFFNKVITHIIANSQETKRTILLHLKDKQIEQKIQIVYHGIENIPENDPDQNILNTEFENSNKIICGNAGRLTAQKGHRHLLEIAKILKARQLPFCIKIAGAGELEQDLKKRISEMQLEEQVMLLGFVSDMQKIYA
ncbi:MAG: glycosyltransferase [Saprospiraceae bacterium]|nr:glycosyltransferase [Saprospiraceae bacterium]